MKRWLILGLIFFYQRVTGQFYDSNTWHYSFTLGGVFSSLSHQYTFNSDEYTPQIKVNFSVGGNIHYRITEEVSLATGLFFLRAGGDFSTERFNASAFRKFTMTYFQIPFGLSYQPERWIFEVGGYGSYLLDSRVSIHRDEMLGSTNLHLINETNWVDGGVFAGAGYSFQLESDANFTVGGRYYQGLADVFTRDFGLQENNYRTVLHQVFFL